MVFFEIIAIISLIALFGYIFSLGFRFSLKKLNQKEKAIELMFEALRSKDPKQVRLVIDVTQGLINKRHSEMLEEHESDLIINNHKS